MIFNSLENIFIIIIIIIKLLSLNYYYYIDDKIFDLSKWDLIFNGILEI